MFSLPSRRSHKDNRDFKIQERICLHAMELVPSVFDILEYLKNILPSVESL